MSLTIAKPKRLRGRITPPGDKSISHRAAIFNTIATGSARVQNFSSGQDCLSTLKVLNALGADIRPEMKRGKQTGTLNIEGMGISGLRPPTRDLDAGNSGTTTRLMSGILAGQDFHSIITGDKSIRSRPMGRIISPLQMMGAKISARNNDTQAPISFNGGILKGIKYNMPVASAQLKSCLILAALRAEGQTRLIQPNLSRDHSERMLKSMGAKIEQSGLEITISRSDLHCVDVSVPGDTSSAAFWIIAGLIHPDAELTVCDVGLNPTRAYIIEALKEMGADIYITNEKMIAGEPVGDLFVRSSELRGIEFVGEHIPLIIDEIPILALAAAMAKGETVFKNAAELRVKETDRIKATAEWLSQSGVDVNEYDDGMIIKGKGFLNGGVFESYGDHRIAMTLGIAALVSQNTTTINGSEIASISYPSFWNEIRRLGGIFV